MIEVQNEPLADAPRPTPRSAKRIRAEAEVSAIRRIYGDIESMRTKMGLSRRRVCEYLLVDPSAWSRWTHENSAPPHVYKTLALLMGQFEANPALFNNKEAADTEELRRLEEKLRKELNETAKAVESAAISKGRTVLNDLRSEDREFFLAQIEMLKQTSLRGAELGLGWKLLLIFNTLVLAYKLFF